MKAIFPQGGALTPFLGCYNSQLTTGMNRSVLSITSGLLLTCTAKKHEK